MRPVVAHVVVVGAGWSGLAAAIELSVAGMAVTLLDAAPQAGGRARRLDVTLGDRWFPLDNGQHLLLGAYRETRRLLQLVRGDSAPPVDVVPFALLSADGLELRARRLPAPLHLVAAIINARGWTWRERIALLRWVRRQQAAAWTVAPDRPALELMRALPPRIVRRLWEPLCLAALNAPLAVASAHMLLTVLRDSLGSNRGASDLVLPHGDLSALLPDCALPFLQDRGADVRLREPVQAIERSGVRDGNAAWALELRERRLQADAVVLALPPARASALVTSALRSELNTDELKTAVSALDAIATAPIATVYLRYAGGTRLAEPMLLLDDDPARSHFAQWAFDRGALDPRCDGVLSAVISGRGVHEALTRDELAQAVSAQFARTFSLPAPIAAAAIVEKQATILPVPNLQRPPPRIAAGLFLAGDSVDSPYPSTIEGSVRAGVAAARAVAREFLAVG